MFGKKKKHFDKKELETFANVLSMTSGVPYTDALDKVTNLNADDDEMKLVMAIFNLSKEMMLALDRIVHNENLSAEEKSDQYTHTVRKICLQIISTALPAIYEKEKVALHRGNLLAELGHILLNPENIEQEAAVHKLTEETFKQKKEGLK